MYNNNNKFKLDATANRNKNIPDDERRASEASQAPDTCCAVRRVDRAWDLENSGQPPVRGVT